MNVQIIPKQYGGTGFLARPDRLHLGAQNASGVDKLHFALPEAWAGCAVALYLRRADGTLLAPVTLDAQHSVTVDRRLTGSTSGQWMLAAVRADGYTAYTRPGSYDTYAVLPTDGGAEELPPSQYEQFVARVLENASTAATAAQKAAASADSAAADAAQAQASARRTSTDRENASQCAARAEAAAARAEELAPADGSVLSVNGKGGVVTLTVQDLGALPRPAQPVSGQLLRVFSVDPITGALQTDTTPMPDLTPYVRSSTIPTASTAGAVRVDPACGIRVRSDGLLATAPAERAQLDSMSDTSLPLTAALLPYGVKKALTTASAAGAWTAAEKTQALQNLGIDPASYYTKGDIDGLIAAVLSNAHPVGSIYQSTSPTHPSALFGGTWEQIASERVLMGASSAHGAGTTVEAGLPNIAGDSWIRPNESTMKENGCFYLTASRERNPSVSSYSGNVSPAPTVGFDASRSSAVYGASSTVQPAAYYVYMWRRTA